MMEGVMGMDTTEQELTIEAVPEEMVVTEAMGLVPEAPPSTEEAPAVESDTETVSLDEQELKGIIESLLYVSHEPLTVEKVTAVLAGPPKGIVHNTLRALQQDYGQDGRGLHIVEIAGGFSMVTRPDCAPWITRLHKVKASAKVSRSAMETLAIIAYKQPMVRAEIEQIRGVETSGVLRTLLDQKLIRMVGRKDIPGRPIMYGTSKVFLERFGLRDLRDLPPLREFNDLGQGETPDLFSDDTMAMLEEGDTMDGDSMEADSSVEAEEMLLEQEVSEETATVQEEA
jgi:segregation and condensation protein B